MLRSTFVTLFLFIHSIAAAEFIDTIKASLHYPPKFIIRMDSRNSFISTRRARMSGIKIGVEFDKVFRIGGGVSWLNSKITKDYSLMDGDNILANTTATLKFWVINNYVEYVFYDQNKWKFYLPIQLGIGSSNYEYSLNSKRYRTARKAMIVYETNITGYYRAFHFIGIGVGIGYRILLLGNKSTDENFNSPIYIFKVTVFLEDVYKPIINKVKMMHNA